MQKVCRKSALKASPITLPTFGKLPKTGNTCKRLLKFLKRPQQSELNFSFALSPHLQTRS